MDYNTTIKELKGIGEKTEKLFHRVGVYTAGDVLEYYPRDYDICEPPVAVAQLEEDRVAAVEGMISSPPESRSAGRLKILTVVLRAEPENLVLTWFNMPYLRGTLKQGTRFVFRGRVSRKKGRLTMDQPQIFNPAVYQGMIEELQPVYALTAGLTNKLVTKTVKQVFEQLAIQKEYLPESIRQANELAEFNYAVQTIHFPNKKDDLLYARKRLVFDEFFLFILSIQRLKEHVTQQESPYVIESKPLTSELIHNLPYELTNAQKKVWEQVEADMTGPHSMSRLIQGDVGSGKTIIAILALLLTAANGLQGALMVPTEVLARQHYESLTELLEEHNLPFRVILLTGSMTAKEKRKAYDRIEIGMAHIIIGTHALIQDRVVYDSLALVVTDEQHRFGVRQREVFSEKGSSPHILVMSATPIPRTLAIILYGDLDISVIDERPAQRLPIKNCVVDTGYRPKAYSFIQKEVEEGRQVYIICAMVEESESIEAENVIDYSKHIQQVMPPAIQVAYLHGAMHPREKNDIMERFARNEIQILVSTTVIEVGINVPNATVMMVENAERFGLAQLHQLRGRVGRGKWQSYCIFVSASKNENITKRLKILNKSNDGFFIASEDLKLRGPGDLFGLRQSGLLQFKIGDVFNDASILQAASAAAKEVLDRDPDLETEELKPLHERLDRYQRTEFVKFSL